MLNASTVPSLELLNYNIKTQGNLPQYPPTHPRLWRHRTLCGMSVAHTAAPHRDLAQGVEVGPQHLGLRPAARERQQVRVERQDRLQADSDVAGADELEKFRGGAFGGWPAGD